MSENTRIKLVLYTFFIVFLILLLFTFRNLWNDFANLIESKKIFFLPRLATKEFLLGLDLKGGVSLLYETDLSLIPTQDQVKASEGAREVIERRVNFFGFTESQVALTKSGASYRILVEIPGKITLDQAKALVGETPVLDFREEAATSTSATTTSEEPFKLTPLNGRMLKRAQVVFNPTTYAPEVEIEFNDEGRKIFADLTQKNLNKRLAIYLDGAPITIPVVRDVITDGRAVISGNFSLEEAKKLATRLNAGALPVPVKLISSQQIGSILGEADFQKTLKAGAIGVLILIIYLIVYYRLLGVVSVLSLGVYAIIILFIYKNLPITLTLSGLAGFIVSIGMAVDANVLIFERIKEELLFGKDLYLASDDATKRAWTAIRDSNLTTLLIMLILYMLGTSFVKGFSLTLSLGIIVSIMTNFFLTRYILLALSQTKLSQYNLLYLPFYILKNNK